MSETIVHLSEDEDTKVTIVFPSGKTIVVNGGADEDFLTINAEDSCKIYNCVKESSPKGERCKPAPVYGPHDNFKHVHVGGYLEIEPPSEWWQRHQIGIKGD